MNPVYTPIVEDGKIVDVNISYPDDYVMQMLRYGKTYSYLN
jgi:dipeptidyl-peptidase-3